MADHAQSSADAASGCPAWCWALLAVLLWAGAPADAAPTVIVERLPNTLERFELVEVPAGRVVLDDPRHPNQPIAVSLAPFYLSRTEVRWDEFLVWVYGLDRHEVVRVTGGQDDACIVPTILQGTLNLSYGSHGYPVNMPSSGLCVEYCRWLTARTGHHYRLPTEAEWLWACLGGAPERAYSSAELDAVAWYGGKMIKPTRLPAGPGPMPVGTMQPNGYGLFDMLGNVPEWCVRVDGTLAAAGGGWRDPAEQVQPRARESFTPNWQRSGPMRRRSDYWSRDADWVGLRVLREMDPPQP